MKLVITTLVTITISVAHCAAAGSNPSSSGEKALWEEATIGKACQRVVVRHIFDLPIDTPTFGYVPMS